MRFKAVIFDIGGVLIRQPQIGIRKYERELGAPAGFLGRVFMKDAPNNSFCQLERGELLFSEFLPKFDAEVRSAAKADNVDLRDFNVSKLFDKMTLMSDRSIHMDMFSAVKTLRKSNIKTCALTNNWIDDREYIKAESGGFMVGLRRYFDVIIESAVEKIRKPDPRIYKMACEQLSVHPSEVIFLDDIGKNLKPASEMGITCIKVENPSEAVEELEKLVEFKLVEDEFANKVYPPPVKPNDVPHGIANLKSGIKMHYVELGQGPVVLLFHGFPDLWYSWRHQLSALASCGYRAIAVDQRGFGDSSVTHAFSDYSQENLCRDALDFMDTLGIDVAAIVGHDWGGAVVWNLALSAPHRFTAVCAITTPLFTGEGLKRLLADVKTFDYQLYFQQEGKAEKEFNGDVEKAFKLFFRGFDGPPLRHPDGSKIVASMRNVTERGNFFKGFPEEIERSHLLTEEDLNYYVQQYRKSGFRGPLNLYRNTAANREWQSRFENRKIGIPALMVTASDDFTLRPEFTIGMEDRIRNLERADLKRCNHWVHIERPDEVNNALIPWLDKFHKRESKL